MLYGSKYTVAADGRNSGDDGINGIKVGDSVVGSNGINRNGAHGINGASGIQTGNGANLTNDKKAIDALNGVAHT
jgi:hypothetical protein